MTSTEKIYHLFCKYPEISTDSRKIKNNSLFFALKGENFNGNKYASEAIKKGAAFAIVDEIEFCTSDKIILVDNVLKMLQQLARMHRDKLNIPILAITGTNGKTTTKELVSSVLSEKYKVCFTQGNLNNHIGVPLTLLQMNSKTQFGVVEMGANHPGEIKELCEIANPDFGIITNVGRAHLEGFGSFEGVKKTKAELYNFLHSKNGIVFINKDNAFLIEMAKENRKQFSYGVSDADLIGESLNSPPFAHVKANFPKGVLFLNSNLIGNFNCENILAAACIGQYFEIDPLKIQQAIKKYKPQNIRSQLIIKDNLKIIMDAYNANPTSMLASVKSFVSDFPDNNYLILGDMLELGDYAEKEHVEILETLNSFSVKDIFLVGPIFMETGKNFNFKTFPNIEELSKYFKLHKIKNGNLLIKGSRGISLEKLLEIL